MEKNLPQELVKSLNGVFGEHKARAVHAKGIILKGYFHPSLEAKDVTKAEHFNGSKLDAVVLVKIVA